VRGDLADCFGGRRPLLTVALSAPRLGEGKEPTSHDGSTQPSAAARLSSSSLGSAYLWAQRPVAFCPLLAQGLAFANSSSLPIRHLVRHLRWLQSPDLVTFHMRRCTGSGTARAN